jgi:hypothetical protein
LPEYWVIDASTLTHDGAQEALWQSLRAVEEVAPDDTLIASLVPAVSVSLRAIQLD